MTAYVDDRHRTVVPRWRPVIATISTGEAEEPLQSTPSMEAFARLVAEKTESWREQRHPLWAADLLSCAVTAGDAKAAREAAAAIVSSSDALPFSRALAERHLAEPADGQTDAGVAAAPTVRYRRIHALRLRLRANPRNAFTWLDLAFEYTCLGESAKALQAAGTAQSLAPENRLLLRATARLLIHTGDLEAAHSVLSRAKGTQDDPWLMAAEVATATAAGKGPRFPRLARAMIADRSRTQRSVSELAAALASLSLQSGRSREARRLFESSLLAPTENALAQATWAWRRDRTLDLGLGAHLGTPRSFEAAAWLRFQAGEWQGALESAQAWAGDQPFSSRPYILASYLAAETLEAFGMSESLAKAGLLASPDDFSLLNNLAFALASQGRVEEASQAFKAIAYDSLAEHQRIVWLATEGLLEYRSGDSAQGRVRYQEAIEKARASQFTRLEVMATARRAMEEIRLGLGTGPSAVEEALSMGHRLPNEADVQYLLSRLSQLRLSAGSA